METTEVRSTRSTRKKEVYKKLFGALGDELKSDVTLAPYTTLGIGGRAEFFYRALKPETLIFAVRTAQNLKMRFLLLGGGSNILVSDSGFEGLVVKNESKEILVNRNSVTCQSGALLEDVINRACTQGLSGLEFAAGIPGTVGGAVRGNAGAFGKSVGDRLTKAVVLTFAGDIKEVSRDYFRFAYRESRLKQTREVLLSATLQLRKGDQARIEGRIAENLKKRKESLPWKDKSAGCFFKNVVLNGKRVSAGLLLDQVGAKRMHQGDAQVFAGHANILINAGSARCADVRKLATKLRRKIREKFGIKLEQEVVYIN
ncbi:MAG: UDP-N-acetylmuramate dehydrogenase [Candidatus Zixiibacteriota bacterium]|nr:MAG: UDP-N-acetylmuramate dehydrogenase [candidate division Zixibacteria bacterium]